MPRRTQASAEGVSQLLQYFYPIQEFLAGGGTAQQAWGMIQDLVDQGAAPVTGATIFDMNEVAGRARALNNAQAAFEAAGSFQEVDASMIAPAPWLGQGGVGQGFDAYSMRASLDLEGLDLATPIYMDVKLPFDISGWSKSELEDYVVSEMQAMLDDYDEDQLAALGIDAGLTVTGLSDMQIMQL